MIRLPEPKKTIPIQEFEQDVFKLITNEKYGELNFREIVGSLDFIKTYLIGLHTVENGFKIKKASEK